MWFNIHEDQIMLLFMQYTMTIVYKHDSKLTSCNKVLLNEIVEIVCKF